MLSDMEVAVDLLERLGLTAYEAKTYVGLVGLGPSGASEISEASGVPRTRVYSVLADLEDRGWVEARGGRPKTFVPERPSACLGRLQENLEEEIESTVPMLEAQYEEEATQFGGPIWLLETAKALGERTVEMVQAAKTDVLLVASFELPCDGRRLEDALQNAIERGARVRAVAPAPELVARYIRKGVDARVGWVPPRLLFVDERQTLVGFEGRSSNGGGNPTGVWVPAPRFAKHVEPVREQVWSSGQPLDASNVEET